MKKRIIWWLVFGLAVAIAVPLLPLEIRGPVARVVWLIFTFGG